MHGPKRLFILSYVINTISDVQTWPLPRFCVIKQTAEYKMTGKFKLV